MSTTIEEYLSSLRSFIARSTRMPASRVSRIAKAASLVVGVGVVVGAVDTVVSATGAPHAVTPRTAAQTRTVDLLMAPIPSVVNPLIAARAGMSREHRACYTERTQAGTSGAGCATSAIGAVLNGLSG